MKTIVALGSGKASTIEYFCQKIISEKSPLFKIKALLTENPHSGVVTLAKKFNLALHIIEYKSKSFADWDKELSDTLSIYQPQWILLAGFLKKIGPVVLEKFNNKIINSHPALLPEFGGKGMYGSKIHQSVIQQKKKNTGITIHIVNEEYDKGPLLNQKKVAVKAGESAEELEKRVKKIEKEFYFETLTQMAEGKIIIPYKT